MDIAAQRTAEPVSADALRVPVRDDVAVALRPLEAGTTVDPGGETIRLAEAIPQSHKFAVHDIKMGEPVRKYGWPIGAATAAIGPGEHVHTHNVETLLRGEEKYRYEALPAAALPSSTATFL